MSEVQPPPPPLDGPDEASRAGAERGPDEERERQLDEGRMPFLEHLRDLRARVRNAMLWLLVGFVICYVFAEQIYAFLARPLIEVWLDVYEKNPAVGLPSFQFKSLIEPFWAYFSVALWAGFFVASPFIFYELWKFIAPGLYRNERRYSITFAVCSAVLFFAGAVFCYTLMEPVVFRYFLNYSSYNISKLATPLGTFSSDATVSLRPQLFMQEFFDISRRLVISSGLIFELPLIIFFLSLVGAVTHRSLLRFWRWMLVLAATIGAILSPPDVFSQMLMTIPLVVMYFLSTGIAFFVTRARERRQAREASA